MNMHMHIQLLQGKCWKWHLDTFPYLNSPIHATPTYIWQLRHSWIGLSMPWSRCVQYKKHCLYMGTCLYACMHIATYIWRSRHLWIGCEHALDQVCIHVFTECVPVSMNTWLFVYACHEHMIVCAWMSSTHASLYMHVCLCDTGRGRKRNQYFVLCSYCH